MASLLLFVRNSVWRQIACVAECKILFCLWLEVIWFSDTGS